MVPLFSGAEDQMIKYMEKNETLSVSLPTFHCFLVVRTAVWPPSSLSLLGESVGDVNITHSSGRCC